MKYCKNCLADTDRLKDGRCKPCKSISNAKWRNSNVEKIKKIWSKYYKDNSEKIKVLSRIWRENNKERANKNVAKWKKENPIPHRLVEQNRRAAKKASNGKLSKGLSDKLFILQKGKCPCCNLPLGNNFHLDHITPIALGGANEDWNIQLLRQKCNNQKGCKPPVEFMQSRGFLI